MTQTTISMSCTRCGSTKFLFPHSGQLRDSEVITCNGCKGQITAGEARKQAIKAAEKAVADALRRALK